jgi:serine/threonine protein kinase
MTEFAAGASLHDGRYALERRLGAGGMAAVWLARDEVLGRPVAIKALSDLLADEEGYVRRFRREARVVAGLSHPNLVRVFDFGDDPRPYLVMEYVEGGTLADRLGAGERDFDCEGLVRGLLDALDHVHAARIVHRDIKPSNVLMGTEGRPRLTDFGIAMPEDATRLTQAGGVMGTARYLAPEVLEGKPATPASDLYSLGMLLRECVEPCDEPLATLAARLTARDPAERPQSAAEALALLEDRTVPLPETGPPRRPVLPEPRVLPDGRREYELRVGGRGAAIGVGLLAALVLVIVLASGGGGDGVPAPAPRDAPLTRQLDALARAVQAAP